MPKKQAKPAAAQKYKQPVGPRPMAGPTTTSLAKRLDQLMQRIPRGSFAAAGGALGGPTGALVGKAVSNITGYGDYSVTHNTVGKTGAHGGVEVPSFSNRSVRITHREYFADIRVPADGIAFNNTVFDLSPTNPNIAPWLSTIARKFAKYRIHGLVFYYKPMSTDYNNSGTVSIAVNYDPTEDAYESMSGMLNSKFAVSTKPSVAMVAPVECDPNTLTGGGILTVDHPNITTTSDKRFTSMGSLNVATSGLTMPPGSILGQLHMTVDLELINPFLHKRQEMLGYAYGTAADYTSVNYQISSGYTPLGVELIKDGRAAYFKLPVGTYRLMRRYDSANAGTQISVHPKAYMGGPNDTSLATVTDRNFVIDASANPQNSLISVTVTVHTACYVWVVGSGATNVDENLDVVSVTQLSKIE